MFFLPDFPRKKIQFFKIIAISFLFPDVSHTLTLQFFFRPREKKNRKKVTEGKKVNIIIVVHAIYFLFFSSPHADG